TGPCRHKLQLSEQQMASLDSGASIPVGKLTLAAGGASVAILDVTRSDAATVADLVGTDAPLRPGCQLSPDWLSDVRGNLALGASHFNGYLFGGASWAIGPQDQILPIVGFGGSTASSPPLAPGKWRLHVEAGRDIAAFEHAFRVPESWLPENY